MGFLDDRTTSDIKGYSVLGRLSDFSEVIKKFFVEEIIITSEKIDIHKLIEDTQSLRLGVKLAPPDFEKTLYPLSIEHLGTIPLLLYKQRKGHPAEVALKRIIDILVSLVLTIILFPFFIIISLVIKVSSRGPVLYIQKRCGFKGKEFNFYKFRSMVKSAES